MKSSALAQRPGWIRLVPTERPGLLAVNEVAAVVKPIRYVIWDRERIPQPDWLRRRLLAGVFRRLDTW